MTQDHINNSYYKNVITKGYNKLNTFIHSIIILKYICFILYLTFILIINRHYIYTFGSSVKCIGTKYNRTCIYKNIYYRKGEWIIINISQKYIKCVAIRSRSSNLCFKPKVQRITIKHNRVINGLSTYIGLFFAENIGHLLWDDLYSMYLSFLKLNIKMDSFTIILSRLDSQFKNNPFSKIFEKFSMKYLVYEKDMINDIFLISTLVVGLGHQCQRCITKEYSIPGGKEYKAIWWMRKRMRYVYNITQCENRYAIIVNNKRYSRKEKEVLYSVIKSYSKRIKILYIDWKMYHNFKQQLKILSCTYIYISGPGTGLLNFPFISDPGVIINLGGLYRGCPSFMEQYIEEGSMHFISLYYPSNKRIYGLNEIEIKLLIDKAINIINKWYLYKKSHLYNLNIEGKIFIRLSKKYPDIMNKFLEERDWASNYGFGVWAEKLIYFPYCYNISDLVEIVLQETVFYKKELGCNISNSRSLCYLKNDLLI